MADRRLDVLTYHSISGGPGPTSIPPDVFEAHLDALADLGYRTLTMQDVARWLAGSTDPAQPAVAITFDDGFADFAEHAYPRLAARGFTATVFLPTGALGGRESWDGANDPPRPLLDWDQVADLADRGIEFGGHSIDHPDLTRLTAEELDRQIGECRAAITGKLGSAPCAFAPPYGRAGDREIRAIGRHFSLSFGTRFQRVRRGDDPLDVPRIEMHYYRDPARWRRYLERRGRLYFEARRALRSLRLHALAAAGRA